MNRVLIALVPAEVIIVRIGSVCLRGLAVMALSSPFFAIGHGAAADPSGENQTDEVCQKGLSAGQDTLESDIRWFNELLDSDASLITVEFPKDDLRADLEMGNLASQTPAVRRAAIDLYERSVLPAEFIEHMALVLEFDDGSSAVIGEISGSNERLPGNFRYIRLEPFFAKIASDWQAAGMAAVPRRVIQVHPHLAPAVAMKVAGVLPQPWHSPGDLIHAYNVRTALSEIFGSIDFRFSSLVVLQQASTYKFFNFTPTARVRDIIVYKD